MRNKPGTETVDGYIAAAPKEVRGKLRELRRVIRAVVPDAVEKISYRMPYYHWNGRLAYFGLAKHHIGLYLPTPVVEMHRKDLKGFAAKGATVRLPLDSPLPARLIRKLVKTRMKLNLEHAASRKIKTR